MLEFNLVWPGGGRVRVRRDHAEEMSAAQVRQVLERKKAAAAVLRPFTTSDGVLVSPVQAQPPPAHAEGRPGPAQQAGPRSKPLLVRPKAQS